LIELVLGGNKSGKSDFGLELLSRVSQPSAILVTGKSRDLSFRSQIAAHRKSRSTAIRVVEVHTDLAGPMQELAASNTPLLIDSLDFWMFSLMELSEREAGKCRQDFFDVLGSWKGSNVILISTEMGLGPLAFDGKVRAFARDLGQLNREIASLCTSVYLVVAGLAQKLK